MAVSICGEEGNNLPGEYGSGKFVDCRGTPVNSIQSLNVDEKSRCGENKDKREKGIADRNVGPL